MSTSNTKMCTASLKPMTIAAVSRTIAWSTGRSRALIALMPSSPMPERPNTGSMTTMPAKNPPNRTGAAIRVLRRQRLMRASLTSLPSGTSKRLKRISRIMAAPEKIPRAKAGRI